MRETLTNQWRRRELSELLVFMVAGTCVWFAGARLGLFAAASQFAIGHDLLDLLMLCCCMAMGVLVAAVRKSLLLRRAMEARSAAEAAAETGARHDALTGLANRRVFCEALDAALAARPPGALYALLAIDLDRFKPINDHHGHDAGNSVLCAVADRLRQLAPPEGVAARLDSDEFAMFAPAGQSYEAASRAAQRVIAAIRKPIVWNGHQLCVDATVGVAVTMGGGETAEDLLHAADIAMHQGKRDGRGRACFFRAEMDAALKSRAQIERDLRQAIALGEIAPFYQPIVSLPDQDVVGFEVLARWKHATRGWIPPSEFIPIAEDTGVIGDLFCGVLRQACRDARSWPPYVQLSVNVSPAQFADPRLPERILAILTETGFAPSRLEVEITESGVIGDFAAARAALTSLQNLGVRIALDDFGTGYSSLFHLKELKFNKLKIDKSYIDAMNAGRDNVQLVDAVIQLAASLSLQTTAEGVETDAHLDWLAERGCTYAQGNYFAAAMAKESADGFIERRSAARERRVQPKREFAA